MTKEKIYMVLDCETATLPFIKQMNLSPVERQKISIAKPIIYDVGWTIVNKSGEILKRVSYLVQETFFVPQVFNTAYYREKRPMYMDKLAKGEITSKLWNDIEAELLTDCEKCEFVSAYNAMFDFKKAIPFTHSYITHLYSNDYDKWEYGQRKHAEKMLANRKSESNEDFDSENFLLCEKSFPMVDLWAVAVKEIVNNFLYRRVCTNMPMLSASGLYFKTSAESVYRYLNKDYNFEEEHTALADAEIESEILRIAFKRKATIEIGLTYFPFKELGTTFDFCVDAMKQKKKVKREAVENVLDAMETYLDNYRENGLIFSSFEIQMRYKVAVLTNEYNQRFEQERKPSCPEYDLLLQIHRCENRIKNAKTPKQKENGEKELTELKKQLAEIMEG